MYSLADIAVHGGETCRRGQAPARQELIDKRQFKVLVWAYETSTQTDMKRHKIMTLANLGDFGCKEEYCFQGWSENQVGNGPFP